MMYLNCLLLFLDTNVAVIVSISALGLSFYVAWLQRRHMKLSVKPIPDFRIEYDMYKIRIYLKNVGFGYLSAREISCKKYNSEEYEKILFDFIDEIPGRLRFFKVEDGKDSFSLGVNEEKDLLVLGLRDEKPDNEDYSVFLDVTNKLKNITLNLEYYDIYEKSQCYEKILPNLIDDSLNLYSAK